MNSCYKESVERPLDHMINNGKGEKLSLGDSVLGLRRGSNPDVLITSVHHSPEIYGTYQSVLEFLKKNDSEVAAVPVVDVLGFCYYKEKSNKSLSSDFFPSNHPNFVYDYIKDGKRSKKNGLVLWRRKCTRKHKKNI